MFRFLRERARRGDPPTHPRLMPDPRETAYRRAPLTELTERPARAGRRRSLARRHSHSTPAARKRSTPQRPGGRAPCDLRSARRIERATGSTNATDGAHEQNLDWKQVPPRISPRVLDGRRRVCRSPDISSTAPKRHPTEKATRTDNRHRVNASVYWLSPDPFPVKRRRGFAPPPSEDRCRSDDHHAA